jgi:tetratricopeptide (TPR) repeat protein
MSDAAQETKPTELMPWELETSTESAAPQSPARSDISEWLKNLDDREDEPAAPEQSPSWLTPTSKPMQPGDSESEELPDWLKDSVVSEDTHAPLPIKKQETDSAPRPEDEKIPASFEPVPASAPKPNLTIQTDRTNTAPPRPALLGNDKDALTVQKARELLAQGGLNGAMTEYSRLIKKGKLLEDIIFDLQEAVYSHPVDVIIWQTLGDAYFRANRLQEALDAYSKAEGLLR